VNISKKFWIILSLPLLAFDIPIEGLAQSLESGIEEISENQFVDESGYVHVLGEIKNKLNAKLDFVKVNVAYYDSQNKIIGSDFVYSDPSTLLPSQTATYQALTDPSSLASNDISTVKVNYEYQVDGISHQSPGQGNRPVTSNTGQSSDMQDRLKPSDVPVGPDDPDCGRVITGNFTLTANITCGGNDGLIVGGDGTVINLNGYSITGPGPDSQKVGIAIPHSNNVVVSGPGSIHSFQAGVLITGSENTNIHRVTFEGNKIAVFMTNSLTTTVGKNIIGSNNIGIASHSSNSLVIRDNNMTGNELAGITLVNTDGSQVGVNSISGSRNGIFLDVQSTMNTIANNNVSENVVDINNADGLLSTDQNDFLNNTCSASTPNEICMPQATD
jgi:parallel beta-helix repeat protein